MIVNAGYYVIGFVLMALNKIRHALEGYKTPKPFSLKEESRCADYDFMVADGWIKALRMLAGPNESVRGKSVLEIGPGSDLGTGLILLANGIERYSAIDINPLAHFAPRHFYDLLLLEIERRMPGADMTLLRNELSYLCSAKPDRLNYIHAGDLSVLSTMPESFDIVVSQAVFEHVTDIEDMFTELTRAVKKGGYMIAEIDLQAHTRWIRDKDPLNIYRYSDAVYAMFSFKGSPNRLRPQVYIGALQKLGWSDIQFIPKLKLSSEKMDNVRPYLYRRFQGDGDMDCLSGILFAKR